jgi:hypothetical protein
MLTDVFNFVKPLIVSSFTISDIVFFALYFFDKLFFFSKLFFNGNNRGLYLHKNFTKNFLFGIGNGKETESSFTLYEHNVSDGNNALLGTRVFNTSKIDTSVYSPCSWVTPTHFINNNDGFLHSEGVKDNIFFSCATNVPWFSEKFFTFEENYKREWFMIINREGLLIGSDKNFANNIFLHDFSSLEDQTAGSIFGNYTTVGAQQSRFFPFSQTYTVWNKLVEEDVCTLFFLLSLSVILLPFAFRRTTSSLRRSPPLAMMC